MSDTSLNTQDHQLILRYLRKQMTPDELSKFEVRLMNDADLIRETQREEALIAALQECQDALVVVDAAPRVLKFREWASQPLTAAAAVVVLLVTLPMLGFQQSVVRDAAVESLLIASTHYVEGLRDATQSLTIDAEFPLLLNVDAGPNAAGKTFTLLLQEADSDSLIYQADNQLVGAEGYLSLLLRQPVTGDFNVLLFDAAQSTVEASTRYGLSIR